MPQHNSVIVTTLLSWMGAWGSPTAKPSRAWGTVPDSQRHCRVFGTSLHWDVMDGCVELNLRIPMFAWWYFIDLGIEFNTQSFQSRVPGYSLCIWFGPGPRSWLKSLYRKITKKERAKFKAASAALKVTTKKKKADGSTSVSLPKMCFASRKIYNIELLGLFEHLSLMGFFSEDRRTRTTEDPGLSCRLWQKDRISSQNADGCKRFALDGFHQTSMDKNERQEIQTCWGLIFFTVVSSLTNNNSIWSTFGISSFISNLSFSD